MQAGLSKCFRCGSSDLQDKEVEELLRYGRYVVALRTKATACLRCGERYFDRDTVRLFEEMRQKIGEGDLDGFRVTGELLEPIPR